MPRTVTIGVPAYNEARNIGALLRSLLAQREEGFVLEKIVVISDGSKDETADVARSCTDTRIEVREYKERWGKAARMNEIFRSSESDIVVLCDADMIIASEDALAHLLRPFENSAVGCTGGNIYPIVPARTLMERAIHAGFFAREPLRVAVRGGHNVFSVSGFMACQREFFRDLVLPTDLIGTDNYLYFACRAAGWEYRYVSEAKAVYRSPSTLADVIHQNTRFSAIPFRMERHFGREAVRREFDIPLMIGARHKLKAFVRQPFGSLVAFVLYRVAGIAARFTQKRMNGTWNISISTKQTIPSYD